MNRKILFGIFNFRCSVLDAECLIYKFQLNAMDHCSGDFMIYND